MKEKCKTCKWWKDDPVVDKFGNIGWRSITGAISTEEHWGFCCLFPKLFWKLGDNFCGQWKERDND